ncbi:TolC family protein [Chitinophaga sp.]|uniref:TolC family protein n=1 Tax=Chitinophaga sp. TaxID=1869181 RepID=UPI002F954757
MQVSKSIYFLFLFGGCIFYHKAHAQTYTPDQLKDSAAKNYRPLAIKDWQVREKNAKINEDKIKRYPSATLNAGYQYNFILGELSVPAGAIGKIPTSPTTAVLLPNVDTSFHIGEHHNYNAGITFYQPLTQQAKIRTGLQVGATDVLLAEKDKQKLVLQVNQAIDKLYYGILITQKQLEEAGAKLALAKSKLEDVDNALLAGKTLEANREGLLANIADEEQNILKLTLQKQDYLGDLQTLTGIETSNIQLQEAGFNESAAGNAETYKNRAATANPDLQIAGLNKTKAELGIKATRQSNVPDVGLVAGYAYQTGNPILPPNNPFVGLNLKWDFQSLFTNKELMRQRQYQLKQAEENILYTQEQLANDIDKAYRKLIQSQALIAVAKKAVAYRRAELKIQEDKQAAGFNIQTDILTTKASLAKAEADSYGAQLQYLLALSEMKLLTGE